jgi:uncharacterized protein (TIGR03435 family)
MSKMFFLICICQLWLGGADALVFDVASIRPHAPGDNRFLVRPPSNGGFTAAGTTAKFVVMLAYDVQETQVIGGPSWFATEKWDIEARTDDRAGHSVEETRRMLQNMLEERFSLRLHRETQPLPVYVLSIARSGSKLKASDPTGSTNVKAGGNSVSVQHGELARMTQLLATVLGRPVVDRTGLKGLYDFSLRWDDAPIREGGVPGLDAPAAPGTDHGSIFTAIQDQLGLRLEPQRAPIDVIVVDRMDRPSQN